MTTRAIAAMEAREAREKRLREGVDSYLESLGIGESDHVEAAKAIIAGAARGALDPPKATLDAAKLLLDYHRWETEMQRGKAPQRHQVNATIGVTVTSRLTAPAHPALPGVSQPLSPLHVAELVTHNPGDDGESPDSLANSDG